MRPALQTLHQQEEQLQQALGCSWWHTLHLLLPCCLAVGTCITKLNADWLVLAHAKVRGYQKCLICDLSAKQQACFQHLKVCRQCGMLHGHPGERPVPV
jgi:ribosomal protein S14